MRYRHGPRVDTEHDRSSPVCDHRSPCRDDGRLSGLKLQGSEGQGTRPPSAIQRAGRCAEFPSAQEPDQATPSWSSSSGDKVSIPQSSRRAPDYPSEQAFGLSLYRQDVGTDCLQWTQRLRLIEIAVEADLVADLDLALSNPGVGRVRQYLAPYECLDATWLLQRHLFGIAQLA